MTSDRTFTLAAKLGDCMALHVIQQRALARYADFHIGAGNETCDVMGSIQRIELYTEATQNDSVRASEVNEITWA